MSQVAFATKPIARKKKGMAGVIGSLLSAGRTFQPETMVLGKASSDSSNHILQQDIKVIDQSVGIAKVKVVEETNFAGSTFDGFLGRAGTNIGRYSEVTLEQVQKLKDNGRFLQGMMELSVADPVHVYVESRQEKTMRQSLRASGLQKTKVYDETNTPQRVRKNQTVKVRPATALALKFLAEEKLGLFAEIVSSNPTVVMGEICNLPINDNVFGVGALMAILKGLSPPAGEVLEIDERLRRQSLAAQMAVHHYFRFPPLDGMSKALPRIVMALRKSAKNEDLLIQSPSLFLSQIALLLRSILQLPEEQNGKVDIQKFSPLSAKEVQEAAWQAATLIGAAFSYGVQFARTLSKDIQKTENVIRGATEVFTTALGMAGKPSGPAAGAIDTSTVIFGKLAEVVTQWMARPDEALDLHQLAQDLAYLSDSLFARARQGLMVVGNVELSYQEMKELLVDKATEKKRMRRGKLFASEYKKYLSHFKEHHLQQSLKASASR